MFLCFSTEFFYLKQAKTGGKKVKDKWNSFMTYD